MSACDSQVVRLHQRSVEDRWLDQWVKTSEWKPMSGRLTSRDQWLEGVAVKRFFHTLKSQHKIGLSVSTCLVLGVFPTNGVERFETEIAANHWNQKIWNISNLQVATFWNISKFAAFNVQPLQLGSERKAGSGCRPTSFLACCESFWIFDFLKESPSYRSEEGLVPTWLYQVIPISAHIR